MATKSASRRELLRTGPEQLHTHLAATTVEAATYAEEGSLETDQRSEDNGDTLTWDTQTDWEAYQSKDKTEIDTGTLRLADLPDSLVHKYLAPDFTTSNWPDSVGSIDIDNINGLTYDDTAFGGYGGVVSNGDWAETTSAMSSFGNQMDTTWAVAFSFEGYTVPSSGYDMFINSSDNVTRLEIGPHDFEGGSKDKLTFQYQGTGNQDERQAIESSTTVDDGGHYSVVMNKEGTGASDSYIYFQADQPEQNVLTNTGNITAGELGVMGYFYRPTNTSGHANVTMGDVYYFDSALTLEEREIVLSALP